MPDVYDYATLDVSAPTCAELVAHLLDEGVRGVANAGGRLFGVWTPQLGTASDRALVLTVWPDAETALEGRRALLRGGPSVREELRELVVPTVRPTDAKPPEQAGIYVHRWFELASADVEAFVALSAEAWPHFEAAFDANVIGLFAARNPAADAARLLLLTRYASLAEWEASRRGEVAPGAWERFRRRQQLVRRTLAVSTLRAAGQPADELGHRAGATD